MWEQKTIEDEVFVGYIMIYTYIYDNDNNHDNNNDSDNNNNTTIYIYTVYIYIHGMHVCRVCSLNIFHLCRVCFKWGVSPWETSGHLNIRIEETLEILGQSITQKNLKI